MKPWFTVLPEKWSGWKWLNFSAFNKPLLLEYLWVIEHFLVGLYPLRFWYGSTVAHQSKHDVLVLLFPLQILIELFRATYSSGPQTTWQLRVLWEQYPFCFHFRGCVYRWGVFRMTRVRWHRYHTRIEYSSSELTRDCVVGYACPRRFTMAESKKTLPRAAAACPSRVRCDLERSGRTRQDDVPVPLACLSGFGPRHRTHAGRRRNGHSR